MKSGNLYVIKNKRTDLYLMDDYYKPKHKESYFLEDAHKFNSFELFLATKTILLNKNKYEVYKYREMSNKEKRLDSR